MRASSLRRSFFSSFCLASWPPNSASPLCAGSASRSRAVRWCSTPTSCCFSRDAEDMARAGGGGRQREGLGRARGRARPSRTYGERFICISTSAWKGKPGEDMHRTRPGRDVPIRGGVESGAAGPEREGKAEVGVGSVEDELWGRGRGECRRVERNDRQMISRHGPSGFSGSASTSSLKDSRPSSGVTRLPPRRLCDKWRPGPTPRH